MASAKDTLDALTEGVHRPAVPGDPRASGPLPAIDWVLRGYGRYVFVAIVLAIGSYLGAMHYAVVGVGELSPSGESFARDLAIAVLGVHPGIIGAWLVGILGSTGLAYLAERVTSKAWVGALVLPPVWALIWWLCTPLTFDFVELTAVPPMTEHLVEVAVINVPVPLWPLGFFFSAAWLAARYPHWALRWLVTGFAGYFAWQLGVARHAMWTEHLLDQLYVFSVYDPIAANDAEVYEAFHHSGWWVYVRSVSDWLLLVGAGTLVRSESERILLNRTFAQTTQRAAALLPTPSEFNP